MGILGRVAGQNIRTLRESKGWTQQELAKRAGIHVNQLGKYERGLQNIGDEILIKISSALNCEVMQLASGQLSSGLPTTPEGRQAGERLKSLREGRSFEEMEELTGVDRQHWAWYEEGVTAPSPEVAGRIAEALGKNIEDILGRPISKPDPLLMDMLKTARKQLAKNEEHILRLLEVQEDLRRRIEELQKKA